MSDQILLRLATIFVPGAVRVKQSTTGCCARFLVC